MKVFISQPISNKTEEEIRATRIEAIDFVCDKYGDNIEIINQAFFDGTIAEDANRCWIFGDDILRMSEADIIIFAHGYENAFGCRMEKEIAEHYCKEAKLIYICKNKKP